MTKVARLHNAVPSVGSCRIACFGLECCGGRFDEQTFDLPNGLFDLDEASQSVTHNLKSDT